MIERKSYKADIDRHRPLFFLSSFLIIVAIVLLVVNFRLPDFALNLDFDSDEDFELDMDMLPSLKAEDDMVAAPIVDEPQQTSQIRKVEQEVSPEDKAPNESTLTLQSDGEIKDDEPIEQPVVDMDDKELPLRVVEELPQYPGGIAELVKFISKNLAYPKDARAEHVQGKVLISFIVNKDGSYSEMTVEKSVDPRLDNEALRVLRLMKKWKPGHDHGKTCRTKVAIPIVFAI